MELLEAKDIVLPGENDKFSFERDTFKFTVGILGALLPVILGAVLWIDKGVFEPLDSISHYFYTRAGSVFVLVLGLLAFFLIIYKDYEPADFWVSSAAGLAALIVVFFPTGNINSDANLLCRNCSITSLPEFSWRIKLHYISAAVFLSLLAYMSMFLFTKTHENGRMSDKKKFRNTIYRICALIIVLAMITAGLSYNSLVINETYADKINLVFWMEVVALEAFAVSWFTKAELIFGDK